MEVKSRPEEVTARSHGPATAASAGGFPVTLGVAVQRSAETHGDRVFLRRRHSQLEEPVTFRQMAEDVHRLAACLVSRGITKGDRIGLMSENRCEWFLIDLAAATIGAVDVPRGADTAPEEMQFILTHSGCRIVFVENDRLARELSERRAEMPDLEAVCTMLPSSDVDGVTAMPELLAEGDAWLDEHGSLEQITAAVQPDDLLTIVYTSGTTADPKGVMLTHHNVLSNARNVNMVLGCDETDRVLSALPPWHVYERIIDYVALTIGAEIIYTNRRQLKEDLAKQQPTLFAGVPRIWETIHDGIINQCRKLPPRRAALMNAVLSNCRRVGAGSAGLRDRMIHRLLKMSVLKRFQSLTGGRLRIAVSGGGSLPDHVDQTLLGLGIPLINGYGLTETSPVVSVRLPGQNRCGTIGPALPETTVEIRDEDGRKLPDGEIGVIWIHGPGVMQGYYRNPERTDAVIVDGWFNSGDLGMIDACGDIRITGRAKDTIVLASGENVEPERVEAALKVSPFIEQAVVVGQDRKSLGALLVVAADAMENEIPRAEWEPDGDFLRSEAMRKLIRAELDSLTTRSKGFRPSEQIARFTLMHTPMTPDNGFLTATLKVKRHVVQDSYGEAIDEMFS